MSPAGHGQLLIFSFQEGPPARSASHPLLLKGSPSQNSQQGLEFVCVDLHKKLHSVRFTEIH